MGWLHELYIFLTALFLSLIMVPALRRWAIEKRQLDMPNQRKVHARPKPRLGGVAIFIAFLFATLVFDTMGAQARGILAGALILFATGLVDDLYGLTPKKKFAGEICGCLVTMAVGQLYITRLGDLFGMGPIVLPVWLAIPFTVFAIVGVVNALNLLDGLDGLAGGFSVVALGAFLLLGYLTGNAAVMGLSAALLGGIVGFLRFNVYPARIFMGDAGSLTVGFLLGFLAIHLTQAPAGSVKPIIPFIILGLPIIDTVRVMGERIVRRCHPFAPDRTHVHHRFLDLGFHHRFTVIIIHGLTLFWTVVALVFYRQPAYLLLSGYLFLSIAFYTALRFLIRNKDKLPVLRRDSDRSWRESDIYRRLSKWSAHTDPVLVGILVVFLVWTMFSPIEVASQVARLSGVLLIISSVSFFLTRDLKHPFLLALLFIAGMLIAFQSEQIILLDGASTHARATFCNLLFILGGALVLFKIMIRRRDRIFYGSSMDFLLLAMSVSLAILSPELKLTYRLPEVVFKGIVLFVIFKMLSFHSKAMLRWVFWGVHGVLLSFVLRGMVG
jgi:UDP-GlcNAc:undecaprenyl-phosphate GlcNAc-1-phosphate transferase